jgi:hypothetical protein
MQDEPKVDGLSALDAALKLAQTSHLVPESVNEAKVKAALKDAKKLLKQLRGGIVEPTLIVEKDEEELFIPADQSYGMGPRAMAFNANVTPDEQRQIDLATEQFKQSVQRVDNQLLAKYVQAVQDGDYAAAEAILAQAVASQQTNTLFFALLTIGAILLPLYAAQRLSALFRQFGLNTVFSATKRGKEDMEKQARRGSRSHINTVAKDIKKSLDNAIDEELTTPSVEATIKDQYEQLVPLEDKKFVKAVKSDAEIYAFARNAVLNGDSKATIIRKITAEFEDVNRRRANVIAGNEANRVFTMSQFDADQQFLAQNQLTQKAYKRLVSNTGTPEAVCAHIIRETAANPIPFKQDFAEFGKTMEIVDERGKTISFTPKYEKLQSGHIHVNCHCRYELLIRQDDGTFFNTYDMKVLNDFDESKHPRQKDGKFGKKAGVNINVDDADIETGKKLKADIQAAQEAVDWANSGFGDLEDAKFGHEAALAAMSKLYRKHFKANGLSDEEYSKLKRDQYDYSQGGGIRGEDGKYVEEPALMQDSQAAKVHSALTQAILKTEYSNINLHRGQKDFKKDPSGIVSYSDSKAIAYSFGPNIESKMTDVKDILYHYQLDFASVHPSEQEVIVKS